MRFVSCDARCTRVSSKTGPEARLANSATARTHHAYWRDCPHVKATLIFLYDAGSRPHAPAGMPHAVMDRWAALRAFVAGGTLEGPWRDTVVATYKSLRRYYKAASYILYLATLEIHWPSKGYSFCNDPLDG